MRPRRRRSGRARSLRRATRLEFKSRVACPSVESHLPEASRKFFLEAWRYEVLVARPTRPAGGVDDTHACERLAKSPFSSSLGVCRSIDGRSTPQGSRPPRPLAPSSSLLKPFWQGA